MADGLITVRSAHDFPTTLDRLLKVLEAKGVTVFARIDHAAGAASVGLALRPTTVVVFGNPTAGTPLIQAGAKRRHRSAVEGAGVGRRWRRGQSEL